MDMPNLEATDTDQMVSNPLQKFIEKTTYEAPFYLMDWLSARPSVILNYVGLSLDFTRIENVIPRYKVITERKKLQTCKRQLSFGSLGVQISVFKPH